MPDDLYSKGYSPYTPMGISPVEDHSSEYLRSILGGLNSYAKHAAEVKAMQNPFVQEYAKRLAQAPALPKQGEYDTPMYPEAGAGVEGLGPTVGLQTGRAPLTPEQRNEMVRKIVSQANPASGMGMDDGEGMQLISGPQDPVQVSMGAPQMRKPLIAPTPMAGDMPVYETKVHGQREWDKGSPKLSGTQVQPRTQMEAPIFDSPEEFEMFSKMLPYGTQRDVTQMQNNASMENKRIETQQKLRGGSLKASVELLGQMNKRMMNRETIESRLAAARLKAKKGDTTDLLKLAKELGDQANEADRLLQNDLISALDTMPGDSEAYQHFNLTKQAAAQRRAMSDEIMSMVQAQAGITQKRNSAPAGIRRPDEMSDDELNAEIQRLQSER